MSKHLLSLFALVFALGTSAPAFARAPDTFEEDYHAPIDIESPQNVTLELRLGPYSPNYNAFKDTFGGDHGWLYGAELDVRVLTLPYVGQLDVGGAFGWAKYTASATIVPGDSASGEKTKLTLFPLSALAVLRIDALARYTVVPVTFAGKLGADFVRWKAQTGSQTDDSGLNVGLRWGVQAALELDFVDMRSTRRMDEDWGINHTFLFFEFFESKTKSTGDRSFQFGLGLQF